MKNFKKDFVISLIIVILAIGGGGLYIYKTKKIEVPVPISSLPVSEIIEQLKNKSLSYRSFFLKNPPTNENEAHLFLLADDQKVQTVQGVGECQRKQKTYQQYTGNYRLVSVTDRVVSDVSIGNGPYTFNNFDDGEGMSLSFFFSDLRDSSNSYYSFQDRLVAVSQFSGTCSNNRIIALYKLGSSGALEKISILDENGKQQDSINFNVGDVDENHGIGYALCSFDDTFSGYHCPVYMYDEATQSLKKSVDERAMAESLASELKLTPTSSCIQFLLTSEILKSKKVTAYVGDIRGNSIIIPRFCRSLRTPLFTVGLHGVVDMKRGVDVTDLEWGCGNDLTGLLFEPVSVSDSTIAPFLFAGDLGEISISWKSATKEKETIRCKNTRLYENEEPGQEFKDVNIYSIEGINGHMSCDTVEMVGSGLEYVSLLGLLEIKKDQFSEKWLIFNTPGYEGEGISAFPFNSDNFMDIEKKDVDRLVYSGC